MIFTFRAANGAPAALGLVQIQPTTSDLGFNVTQQASQAPGLSSPGVPPPHQVEISTPVLNHTSADFKVNNNASLETIADGLVNDPTFLVPPFHSKTNSVLPSFSQQLEPKSLIQSTIDDLALMPKKFEPYEQLTGISQERPEIVMLTNFVPIFMKEVGHSRPPFASLIENSGLLPFMTDAGLFVDTHLQARQLRYVNVSQTLRSLRTRYPVVGNAFTQRVSDFQKSVDALRDTANFLLELVKSLERLKAQLDVRDDVHEVDPHAVVQAYFLNFTRLNSQATSNVLFDFVRQYLPTTYTITDAMTRLGYTSDNVLHTYSSTKIWLQMMLELRDMLRYHSPEFLDIDPITQRRDSNAVALTRLTTPHFGLRNTQPVLPPLSQLSTITVNQINSTISGLNQAWQLLYQNVHFKTNEAQIAGLANLVSKEYRYSYGLALPDVQQALADQFGYTVSSTANSTVFDSIIGKFGNNITDFPSTQSNSLANLAQKQPAASVAVLTFESKYVDGSTGTFTPGGDYYVDRVLNTNGRSFDVSGLDDIGGQFEQAQRQFSVIVNGMNILATRVFDPYDKTYTQFSSIMASPVDFVQTIANSLLDARTGNTLPQAVNDNLGSIYSFAATNNQVKSALFLFTMARITRNYSSTLPFFQTAFGNSSSPVDNTPLTDALIDNVINAVVAAVPQTAAGNQFVNNDAFHNNKQSPTLSRDAIRASFKAGTRLTQVVESTMQQVLEAFRAGDNAMLNQHTRFNGDLDTTIMMAAFDTMLQLVARYNNQSIVSVTSGQTSYFQGNTTFNISRTTTNHRASYNDLITRLEKEVALVHHVVYAALNSMQKLSGAFKNYSNYLKSPAALDKLHEVSGILNDPAMLRMLMSEQQIMLLAATVHDLVDRISQTSTSPDTGAIDADGNFDADHEIKVLDDSVTLPRLRNAVYGFFGTQEYATKLSYNKKILTVGIPQGFTQRLKQRVAVSNLKKSTFVNKQNDIVNVVVYKVDLENSDIVYKPKRMLFELSRFPVRNDRYFLPIPEKPTIDDVVHAIPTRDFGLGLASATEVTYWALNTDDPGSGQQATFADETYSFLSEQEKAQIVHNHVLSYLLEVYVRMSTGLTLGDHHFDLVDPPKAMDPSMIKLIVDHHVANTANLFATQTTTANESQPPSGGVLFSTTAPRPAKHVVHPSAASQAAVQPQLSNPTGIAGSVSLASQLSSLRASPVTQTLQAQGAVGTPLINLASVSSRNVPVMLHGLRTISNLAHMLTPLADPLAVSKRIVSPKQFDRVFNVVVSPDEFEVDYEKTVRTPQGKQALQMMIQKGDIIPETENYFFRNKVSRFVVNDLSNNPLGRPFVQNRAAPDHALFRFRDRDKSQGDLTFEKYFVTIETYGEDEV